MAKDKIVVATLMYGTVDPVPYTSHLNLWYRIGRDLPEYEIMFHSPWRQPIDVARNSAAETALAIEAKWLLFYDTDMMVHPNLLKGLIERDKPMIMGHCVIRGYPFESMLFKYADEARTQLSKYKPTKEDIKGEIQQMDALGTACTLIRTDIFKHMTKPYFLTGKMHTEDIYMCLKASKEVEGFECWVDYSLICGHQLDPILATPDNAEDLKTFYESGPYNSLGMKDRVVAPKEGHPNPFGEVQNAVP